jgi:hypothetical protein
VALAIGVIEYRIVTVDVVTAGEIELGEAVSKTDVISDLAGEFQVAVAEIHALEE